MRFSSLLTVPAFAALVVASACSDTPASPASAPTAQLAPTATPSFTKLAVPTHGKPLQRASSLQGKVTATKTIGVWGGVIELPQAGASIVVPPFAVDHDVTFTVTARGGRNYAYDFEPHGTTFRVPLVFTQDFAGVDGGSAALAGSVLGYYADGNDPLLVSEVQNFSIDLGHMVGVSTIWHFSGYICMSGRGGW